MENKHYDNLTRLTKCRSVDDIVARAKFIGEQLDRELHQEYWSLGNIAYYVADMYNAMDMLCIHFDMEEETQTIAEGLARGAIYHRGK